MTIVLVYHTLHIKKAPVELYTKYNMPHNSCIYSERWCHIVCDQWGVLFLSVVCVIGCTEEDQWIEGKKSTKQVGGWPGIIAPRLVPKKWNERFLGGFFLNKMGVVGCGMQRMPPMWKASFDMLLKHLYFIGSADIWSTCYRISSH